MQYPDNIVITKESTFTKGVGGNFTETTPGATFTSACRAEPSENNPVIRGVDGNEIAHSWVVYMPQTNELFNFGDKVVITKADGSVFENTVKRPSNGQFNSRIWV